MAPYSETEPEPARFHELKTWPVSFAAVLSGEKRAELRPDDRGFEDGDGLILFEFDPETEQFSGRLVVVLITHAMRGEPLIPAGLVLLSIELYAIGVKK